MPTPTQERVRLQKFLADAGIASRRHAEEYILAGRVLVNNEVVDELPAFVDPGRDQVLFDGTVVKPERPKYFLLHKPPGVVSTNRDPAGRTRAIDLLPPLKQRLFAVGRLDAETSGLMLMTNDGELAEKVSHPRYGVPKTYRAEVKGRVPRDLPDTLKEGVFLSEGRARASAVEIVRATNLRSILSITLREGRNRQVRRMLARCGFPVRKLKRVQIGPLSLKGLPVGAVRELTRRELTALREEVERLSERARRRRSKPGGRGAGDKAAGKKRGRKGEPVRERPKPGKGPDLPTRRIIS